MNGHHLAKRVWLAGFLAFAAPALACWALLAVGHFQGCGAGAAACAKLPMLGTILKYALDAAWVVAMNAVALVPLALVVAVSAILARSPGRAFVGVFAGPTLALFLPILVVLGAVYPGCTINEAGSSCTFWGVPMGDSFSNAAIAPWLAYIIPPVGFAASLAVTFIAFVVKRQRV